LAASMEQPWPPSPFIHLSTISLVVSIGLFASCFFVAACFFLASSIDWTHIYSSGHLAAISGQFSNQNKGKANKNRLGFILSDVITMKPSKFRYRWFWYRIAMVYDIPRASELCLGYSQSFRILRQKIDCIVNIDCTHRDTHTHTHIGRESY
jgi:hypothetical protein